MELNHLHKEIVTLLKDGCTNKEIADRTKLKRETVENMLAAMRKKFECRNSLQLVIKLKEQKIIE